MMPPWLCYCSQAATPDSEVNTISLLWLESEFYCILYSLVRYEIKTCPPIAKVALAHWIQMSVFWGYLSLHCLEKAWWSGWRLLYKSLIWMSVLAVEFVVIRWGFVLTPWVWPGSFRLIYVRGRFVMQLCSATMCYYLEFVSNFPWNPTIILLRTGIPFNVD